MDPLAPPPLGPLAPPPFAFPAACLAAADRAGDGDAARVRPIGVDIQGPQTAPAAGCASAARSAGPRVVSNGFGALMSQPTVNALPCWPLPGGAQSATPLPPPPPCACGAESLALGFRFPSASNFLRLWLNWQFSPPFGHSLPSLMKRHSLFFLFWPPLGVPLPEPPQLRGVPAAEEFLESPFLPFPLPLPLPLPLPFLPVLPTC